MGTGLRACAGAFLAVRLSRSCDVGVTPNPNPIKPAELCGSGGDGVVPFLDLLELLGLLNIEDGSSDDIIDGGVTVRAIGAMMAGCCGCGC